MADVPNTMYVPEQPDMPSGALPLDAASQSMFRELHGVLQALQAGRISKAEALATVEKMPGAEKAAGKWAINYEQVGLLVAVLSLLFEVHTWWTSGDLDKELIKQVETQTELIKKQTVAFEDLSSAVSRPEVQALIAKAKAQEVSRPGKTVRAPHKQRNTESKRAQRRAAAKLARTARRKMQQSARRLPTSPDDL